MGVSTIVSYHRLEINETIPGMLNALYRIPASSGIKDPQFLHVQDSAYYKPDLDGKQDRIFVPSEQIATSIVHMFLTSQLGYDVAAHPGVFALPEVRVTADSLLKDYPDAATNAIKKQRAWFTVLVQMADDDWQVAHRHNMVSDIQRMAARELNLKREWLMTLEEEGNLPSCPFCGTGLLNMDAPVCPHCMKVHNPEKMKELEARLSGKKELAKV